MKIYCVRHGEACGMDEDPERPLTIIGQKDVAKIAQYLNNHDVQIPHIMHSSKLRAKQTAEIFSKKVGSGQLTECETILDEQTAVAPMVEMIKTWHEDTMLVGHVPFMPKLVSALVINDEDNYPIINFPPSAVVCLEHYEHERWIINWILRPMIVPDI